MLSKCQFKIDRSVNRMIQHDERKWCELPNQLTSESDRNQVLDILLALDRMVVELSMRVYNIPRRDRFIMRKQNRRLHAAVREHLPRLAEPSRSTL
ncbi:hypothetical protein SBA7_300046 [Candidatus Sulfotelmatobacter sp. SbA7]|nr:hypothetical protein SBA7_300046 [Candidatus Sulfotelmatobacter sp. SbA7]